jgi:hypothetical protein
MIDVFAESMAARSGSQYVIQFLLELRDLPGSLLDAFTASWFQGGKMSTKNEFIVPSTRGQAFIGTLPFLAFGVVQMIDKIDLYYAPRSTYVDLAFYGLALTGLLIGWIRGFPLWSYSYLGWSLVFAWWWTDMSIGGTNWGFRVWLPFGIVILVTLLWARSLNLIKKFLNDIWNDWTRLSLAMFAFCGFAGLIYDENHHPQLHWFMLASTLTVSAGAWFFLRSSSLRGRVFAILGSFVGAVVISSICDATWDFHAYHGLTPSVRPWYLTILLFTFWLGILFWPALIALIHRLTNRRIANP